jgi:hypothetical protein
VLAQVHPHNTYQINKYYWLYEAKALDRNSRVSSRTFGYYKYTTGLSFAEERIGPLAAIVTTVFYLLVLPNTPENLFASIYSDSLIKTAHQHLLLLVGFDTLIYRKYYDTPPILVGHQDPGPISIILLSFFTLLALFTLLAYFHYFPLDTLIPFVSSKPVRLTTLSQVGNKVLGCVCAGSTLLLAEDALTHFVVKRRPCWSAIKPVRITFSHLSLLS